MDIFRTLKEISNANLDFIESLSEEDLKGFSPVVVQQWLAGADEHREYHTLFTADICNPYVFTLGKHPKLLYKLFCVANGFGDGRYTYIKKQSNKTKTETVKLLCEYYNESPTKMSDELCLYSLEDVVDMAHDLGYTTDLIKKVKEEWTD